LSGRRRHPSGADGAGIPPYGVLAGSRGDSGRARREGRDLPRRRAGARLTLTLPGEVEETFERFVTAELTTIDSAGRPITWPLTPFYRPGDPGIRLAIPLGYPQKAYDARRNPNVALLFSDATGSGIERPSMVLVKGVAAVDDDDLAANRARYLRDLHAKPTGGTPPPERGGRRFDWYFTRIYLHVRPVRVLVWRDGDCAAVPELLFEGGEALAVAPPPPPRYEGSPRRHPRIGEIGRRYDSAVLSLVGEDGFPLSVRVPMSADRRGRLITLELEPGGVSLTPGPVCVTAHDHDEELSWTRNFQVRGNLVADPDGGWVVVPHRVVHGFELPPTGALVRALANVPKIRRFRRRAKRERARRS
jgi:hypothetical protein